MEINMIKDAEAYCKTAIEIANGPHNIPVLELARAHTQAAALAIHDDHRVRSRLQKGFEFPFERKTFGGRVVSGKNAYARSYGQSCWR